MPHVDTAELFDEHGRCLPGRTSAPAHARSRRYFRCNMPTIDDGEIHRRIRRHLAPSLRIREDEFCDRVEHLRAGLRDDPATRNLLAGPVLPFALPQLQVEDIGESFDARFLPALDAAYRAALTDYEFVDHSLGGTAGKLSVRPGSRHQSLLAALARGEVVGLYMPCLSEYSLPAAVERLAALPERFLLSGAFDTAAALIGTPDLLLREDGYPPLLWISGVAGEKPGVDYHFEAYGYNLTFNRRAHLDQAAEYWWHGLTILAAD
ncbi:MAG: hypothetical protein KDG52_11270 [Rhodocyclaceae bacterium]|nr:hypothetical protein [Rhodocyclaceae bacterium]